MATRRGFCCCILRDLRGFFDHFFGIKDEDSKGFLRILGDSFTFEGTFEDFFGIKGKDSKGFLKILLDSKGLFKILTDF